MPSCRTVLPIVPLNLPAAEAAVRDAGGLVPGATNESELQQNFDYILTGKILAEEPASPATKP